MQLPVFCQLPVNYPWLCVNFVDLFDLLPIFHVPLTMRLLTGGPLSALGSGTSFCIVTHVYRINEQINSFSDSDSDTSLNWVTKGAHLRLLRILSPRTWQLSPTFQHYPTASSRRNFFLARPYPSTVCRWRGPISRGASTKVSWTGDTSHRASARRSGLLLYNVYSITTLTEPLVET